MFALIRTLIYLSLIVAVVLAFIPGSSPTWLPVFQPETTGPWQVLGLAFGASGGALVLWCVLLFALVGKGTPIPLDPPRHLVTHGPYRIVRNPMALGVGIVLVGVALYYESWAISAYAAVFFLLIHGMVVLYEEPTLEQIFGDEYRAYRSKVGRWWPKRPAG